MEDNNGWAEYKKLVIFQYEMLMEKTEKLDKEIVEVEKRVLIELKILEKMVDGIKDQVIVLKTKAGIWGGVAGFVIGIIIQIILSLIKQ
jgi:hypothetical protein